MRQELAINPLITLFFQETAINIAYSCRLFSQDMDIIKLNARSRDAAENTIKFYLEAISKEFSGLPTDAVDDEG